MSVRSVISDGRTSGARASGTGAVACAAALAAFVLIRPRRRLVPAPLLAGLRAAHSGHIGDYVAWLVFGTAGLGGLLALLVR